LEQQFLRAQRMEEHRYAPGAGVHRFVAKPYTAEIVLEALRGLLHE